MKTYPTEFRQKIIDVYENEPISQKQLARRFRVASSFIQKLLKQYRTTGGIAPKVRKEQTPTKLNQEQLAKLAELSEVNNDATIAELQDKRLSWIYGDKHRFSVPKSLPSKGSRNLAHKFWYHCYTYPTLNSGEPTS